MNRYRRLLRRSLAAIIYCAGRGCWRQAGMEGFDACSRASCGSYFSNYRSLPASLHAEGMAQQSPESRTRALWEIHSRNDEPRRGSTGPIRMVNHRNDAKSQRMTLSKRQLARRYRTSSRFTYATAPIPRVREYATLGFAV